MKTRNYSRKREAILAKICGANTHPTAEWVYQELKEQYPDLSLATVYRNIALFREEGTVVSVGIVGGRERFDGVIHPHGHFICNQCQAVSDIDAATKHPEIMSRLEDTHQFKVDRVDLIAYGLCHMCAA